MSIERFERIVNEIDALFFDDKVIPAKVLKRWLEILRARIEELLELMDGISQADMARAPGAILIRTDEESEAYFGDGGPCDVALKEYTEQRKRARWHATVDAGYPDPTETEQQEQAAGSPVPAPSLGRVRFVPHKIETGEITLLGFDA